MENTKHTCQICQSDVKLTDESCSNCKALLVFDEEVGKPEEGGGYSTRTTTVMDHYHTCGTQETHEQINVGPNAPEPHIHVLAWNGGQYGGCQPSLVDGHTHEGLFEPDVY